MEKKVDEALVAKVGIANKTKEQLKNLQENLPIGGNMYFELNRIAYKNDIERRKRKIEERYDYGLNVSIHSPILFVFRNLQLKTMLWPTTTRDKSS